MIKYGGSGLSARLCDILAISCSLLTLGCWLVLYGWYSLFDHYSTPGFALDTIPGHFHSKTLRYTALVFLALVMLYVASYWLIRQASTISSGIKLATIMVIVGSGIVNILLYPASAIDLFYYVIELKLAYYYHQNPYLVTFLPSFAADPFARFGWPLHTPLAYGPAWVLLAGPPTVLAGFDHLLRLLLAYKVFSFVLLILSGLVIYAYHDDEKSRWSGAYAFLANPLILYEAVGNAHNDLIMTFFLLATVLALKRESWLTLPLLALAALIKVFAIVLVPLFVLAIFARRWSRTKILLPALVALAIVFVVVMPFWANGKMIGGMLRGMAFANGLKTASVFSLATTYLEQRQASATTFSAVRLLFGGLFVVSALVVVWRLRKFELALAYVLLLLYTLVGSIQPWYWIPVIGLLALNHDRVAFSYLVLASALGLFIYLLDVWARFHSGLPFLQRHLLGTLVLNVPIVGFLGLELWRSRFRGRSKGAFLLARSFDV